ncbi:transglycosylase SLT domain-containing protein [Thiosulfativibrio zosterae]|uniref:Peptidoglycan lytic exotransglycosylase n=1 Tax=Thiosulfativibrio zosterae TaxID=2675053 RepID=A0A6F8PPF4_9GAMM|nr:transporter substrate-binding domain-containing protein [Thiosulfativibrio zosterae]BBP44001.1 peptidoglycan lytic exotransglycosylase [Thiosulfativibrio zosterae]
MPLENNKKHCPCFSIVLPIFLLLISNLAFSATNSAANNQNLKPIQDIPISITKRIQEPFFGDLKALRERRIIRVLVSYNRTNFFVTEKGYRGSEYDLLKGYENYLNRGPLKQRYQTQLVFIPLPFQDLLTQLQAGKGDMVASGITVIPERKTLIDFTEPYIFNVREILVSNKNAPPIKSLQDLSGKQIVVVANSSYIIHLEAFNQALARLALQPIEIIKADALLEAEDILEMVNAGIYDYTVSDNHIALVWGKILDNMEVHQDIIFHYEGKIAWAINKNKPELKKSLDTFIENHAKQGRLLGNSVYKKYFEETYWIKKPLTHNLLSKVDCLKTYFQLYGDFYGFDWHLLAAQGYQESHFEQNKKSPRGAIGIMQIKPSTAREKYIKINNIHLVENNIHAGVKYMAFLRDVYFQGDQYTPEDKVNFALAAYNAGPNRIRNFQALAQEAGLDPHKWFYNVENIARSRVGQETVNYVANIQKTKLFLRASKELDFKRQLHLDKLTEAHQENLAQQQP